MTLSRRETLLGGAALALAYPGRGQAGNARLCVDLMADLPAAVAFSRATPAYAALDAGRLARFEANEPRFVVSEGRRIGLLVEGAAPRRSEPGPEAWRFGGPITLRPASEASPIGTPNVVSLVAAEGGGIPVARRPFKDGAGEGYATASLFLRSLVGEARWRLRLADAASPTEAVTVASVGPAWRRFAVTAIWTLTDGPDKVLSITPAARGTAPPGPLLVAGVQYERRPDASSLVPADLPTGRAADELLVRGVPLDAGTGRFLLELPLGARREAVLFESTDGALRVRTTRSGHLQADVHGRAFVASRDVTADRAVELAWSPEGWTLASGPDPDRLVVRASLSPAGSSLPSRVDLRLGMGADGTAPLDRPLARFVAEPARSRAALATPVVLRPAKVLLFADEFDDERVGRINEHAVGGRPGAPAWRSRYRHARKDVINKEKQIYMDAAFAGTANAPLGVHPFRIEDGVLRILADRADPERVSPAIWGARYTSGCISSELTHWQRYGTVEVRARMPRGKGFWPALWLLPTSGAWPPEIDIVEASGAKPMSYHHGVIGPRSASGNAVAPGGRRLTGRWFDGHIDVTDGFHVYAVEWTPERIAFFVDGTRTFEVEEHGVHEDMYVLANLALGSHDANWIPDPDQTTPFPAALAIDYVRCYAHEA